MRIATSLFSTQYGWRGVGFRSFYGPAEDAFNSALIANNLAGYDLVDLATNSLAQPDALIRYGAADDFSKLQIINFNTGDTNTVPVTRQIFDKLTGGAYPKRMAATNWLLYAGIGVAAYLFLGRKRR